jgi:hypothetical protein
MAAPIATFELAQIVPGDLRQLIFAPIGKSLGARGAPNAFYQSAQLVASHLSQTLSFAAQQEEAADDTAGFYGSGGVA